MAYLGQVDRKASNVQVFNVTSSTSATHDIGWTPPSEQTLIVTINGVKQHTNAFSFSGSTLTLGAALVATDELEVVGINDIGNSLTPVDNSVTASKLGADAVTTVKIQDNAVTLAKMAGGTDGNLITYDASGDPAYVATGAATNVLTSNGAGAAPTFQAAAAGYPSDAWIFRLTTGFNGSQDPVTNSWTKVQYLGSDTFVDPSTGVFTFPSTGIWYIRFQSSFSNNSSYYQSANIKVDTGSGQSIIATGYGGTRDSNEPAGIATISAFFDVTSTSTHKCSFSIGANNASMSTLGSATVNSTYIEFTKVGAT